MTAQPQTTTKILFFKRKDFIFLYPILCDERGTSRKKDVTNLRLGCP